MIDEGKNRSVPFFLQYVLPHTLLTSIMYRAARVRLALWKNRQIRWFIARYGVDISEASNSDPDSYEHFNAFFTRSLRAGSRPLEGGAETIVCPADGRISAIGDVRAGKLLQAKGQHYSLQALLGGDDGRAAAFAQGRFATIYLSPRDYHRVHMPVDGRLREMTYIPGRLFSVNFATARVVARLFTRNERLVCIFDTEAGPMALILVGAMMVAGMQTVWSGPVTPPHGQAMRTWPYDGGSAIQLSRGAEMGRFNTGSTVVVLFPGNRVEWSDALKAGSGVRMGQQIGHVLPGSPNS
ncbi:MAG: archaetidylserine decarboxylase [Gammaproteobacteria bacterium]|nr:MAG: archaetidylserine decarboxylase [Gammaproteobacteria bacterium]